MSFSNTSATKTPCCRVTGDYGADPPICQDHLDEGWYMGFLGAKPQADKATTAPCGCEYGIITCEKRVTCATHAIGPLACCPRATRLSCVCAYGYTCPDHGERHMGSHE